MLIVLFSILENEQIPKSEWEDKNLLGSVVYVVQPLGSISSGVIQETFGRRRCMMGVTIPQFIGWIIAGFATNVPTLFASAVLMGLSIGFMEAPAISFLGEVTQPRYRGMLAAFSEIFLLLGVFFEFAVGAMFYWRVACFVSSLIPILAFLIIYMVPESPTWLLQKGRQKEAEEALCWYRGWVTPDIVRKEFYELMDYLGVANNETLFLKHPLHHEHSNNTKEKKSGFSQIPLLTQSRVYNPMIMAVTYFIVCHCITLTGVRPFLVPVFKQLDMALEPYTVLVVTGVLLLVGSIVCSATIKSLGKRRLTFISGFACTLCCFLITAYIYFQPHMPWVLLALFASLFFFGGLGVIVIPWILVCEIFPTDCRGLGAGVTAALAYLVMWLVTKSYVDLEKMLSLSGVILLYGIIGLLGLSFLYFKLPETEGKSLAEIEFMFNKTKLRLRSRTTSENSNKLNNENKS